MRFSNGYMNLNPAIMTAIMLRHFGRDPKTEIGFWVRDIKVDSL